MHVVTCQPPATRGGLRGPSSRSARSVRERAWREEARVLRAAGLRRSGRRRRGAGARAAVGGGEGGAEDANDGEIARLECLESLEWSEVLRQVARFTRTPFGCHRALRGQGVPVAGSAADCARLCSETELMMHVHEGDGAGDLLDGFRPMRSVLKKVRRMADMVKEHGGDAGAGDGGIERLDARELWLLLTNLRAASALRDDLRSRADGRLAYLTDNVEGDDGALRALRARLEACIPINGFGNLLSGASELLARCREDEQRASAKIQTIMREIRSELMRSDARKHLGNFYASVYGPYGRSCFNVESRSMNVIFEEYAILGKSSSGATAYVEPERVISSNNERATALVSAAAEEERILHELNIMVAESVSRIDEIIECVGTVDLISARTAYTSWLGSPRPHVLPVGGHVGAGDGNDSHNASHTPVPSISIEGTCHPLILAKSLAPLPDAPFWPDERRRRLGLDAKENSGWGGGDKANIISQMAAQTMVARAEGGGGGGGGERQPSGRGEEMRANAEEPSTSYSQQLRASGVEAQGDGESEASEEPVPFDILIPWDTETVIITGPNAGGKTAALKTLGLCCVMGAHGIWPPAARGTSPVLRFYDSVLADIGEAQSLQQNLSTFSGHMQRLNRILRETSRNAANGKSTLVLLDELGSGTDPVEGSALASAAIASLERMASLSVITTHFTQLKELAHGGASGAAAGGPRRLNASPQLDEESLRSTYKLRWGVAGNSYAISLARRIGIPMEVVDHAQTIRGDAQVSMAGDKRKSIAEGLQKKREEVDEQLAAAECIRADAERVRAAVRKEHHSLSARSAALAGHVRAECGHSAQRRRSALRDVAAAEMTTADEVDLAIAEAERVIRDCQADINSVQEWFPRRGDTVTVSQFNRRIGKVVEFSKTKETVVVDMGSGSITLSVHDVLPL